TILGTSRARVHKMDIGNGKPMDMRPMMRRTVEEHHLQALVCLGGGGTIKNALRLADVGIPVLTLPKTIDNDVYGTDVTFGYDTAVNIATEAIDRLHSTAHSHHRIVVVELMGHNTGWLALASGLASGADVLLIPEIPYDIDAVADKILQRKAVGSPFSIVAVAEGAMTTTDAATYQHLRARKDEAEGEARIEAKAALQEFEQVQTRSTEHLAEQLEELTGLESRVTILGHVQRGGTPSPADRMLATRLGVACVDFIAEAVHGVMVAARGPGRRCQAEVMAVPRSILSPQLLPASIAIFTTLAIVAFEGLAITAALPEVAGDLGNVEFLPWVITSFLLASAVATAISGT